MTILFTSIICFMTGSFKRRWSDKQLLHVGWFVLSADGILINFELTVHLQRILTAKQSAKIILGFWVCFANIIVWKLHCNMGMTSSTINKDKIEKNVVICQWWLVNTSFFKRHWQAPLKVNMQFKAKKVTLLCWSWLACTDRTTLSAIVYLEWSPPRACHSLWKMMCGKLCTTPGKWKCATPVMWKEDLPKDHQSDIFTVNENIN